MQFTQALTSTSAQSPSVFKFGQNDIRVFNENQEPWFVAVDVCKALSIKNPSDALKVLAPNERARKFLGRQGEANIISESGLYVLILRCQDAIKEGSVAYEFRIWVTKEVLPAIRKTGQYSTTEKSSKVATLTPAQQLAIQNAVAKRAKGASIHFHTIYRAIKLRFQIAKYDQLPQSQFEDCLEFIRTVDLYVPEPIKSKDPSVALMTKENLKQRYAVINSDEVIVRKDSVMKLLNEAERTLDHIRSLESHLVGCIHEAIFRIELSRNA